MGPQSLEAQAWEESASDSMALQATLDFYLSCFLSFSSLQGSAVATNNLWKWRTAGMRTCALGHLEQCVLNTRGKDRCNPAKYGIIVVGLMYV